MRTEHSLVLINGYELREHSLVDRAAGWAHVRVPREGPGAPLRQEGSRDPISDTKPRNTVAGCDDGADGVGDGDHRSWRLPAAHAVDDKQVTVVQRQGQYSDQDFG